MRRPYLALLALALLAAGASLARHAPFAFYSPDMGLHTAKILRVERGEWFRDPVSGTPTIYPALFHVVFATLKRGLGLGSFETVRLVLLVNFLGLLAAFFLLARSTLGVAEEAALATLLLPLLFHAPTGRHVLVESPANFALPLLLLGYALIQRHLARPAPAALFLGCFCASFATGVVWYEVVPLAAFGLVWLGFGARHREALRGGAPWAAALGVLLPCAFTAYHFFAIREVLPAYGAWVEAQVRASAVARPLAATLAEWASDVVTKGNGRFAAALERSSLARLHYYGLVLPFTLGLVGFVVTRLPALRGVADRRQRDLALAPGVAAALVFLLSLGLNAQKDPPRVQFVGWALLLLFAFRLAALAPAALGAARARRGAAAARVLLAVAGLSSLAYTVAHTDEPFAAAPPRSTQAVLDLIRGLPGHAEQRIFATRASLRRLNVFVPFLGFVNHSDGGYQGQDPETVRRLLRAYETIEGRRDGWRDVLRDYGVRYLAFRHVDADERRLGLAFLGDGRAALQNGEWWVVEIADQTAAAQR